VIESAGADAAIRGNDDGTASQIRPQAVSVWVGVPLGATDEGVDPPGTGVNSVPGEEATETGDGAEDREEAAGEVGASPSPPHAVAIRVAATRALTSEALDEERWLGSVIGPS
jgi:hypothetical protein